MDEESTRAVDEPGTGHVDGVWLARCQRISLALAGNRLTRWLWLPLGRRLRQFWAGRVGREQPARLFGNQRIQAHLGEQIDAGIFWFGFPPEDRPALEALVATLPPDAVVLDVGANIGAFALPLAAAARRGVVHAFEPATATVQRLRRHLQLNGLDNVVVNHCAVSDRTGTLSLWIPADEWKGRLFNSGRTSVHVGRQQQGWREESVPCLRLDDYVAGQSLQRVDAIKIDVEGAELDVLEGARELLTRFRPVVVMELNAGPLRAAGRSVADVLAFWRSLDYRVGMIAASGRVHWGRLPRDSQRHQNICCAPAA